MIIDGEHVRLEYDRLIEMSHFLDEDGRRSITGVLHVLAWVMDPDNEASPGDIIHSNAQCAAMLEAEETDYMQ